MNDHWLVRPQTIRMLWIAFIAILVLVVAAELAVKRHAYFGIDSWFGFNAWYGFATCVAMVVFAKMLGALLKRGDDYYDNMQEEEAE